MSASRPRTEEDIVIAAGFTGRIAIVTGGTRGIGTAISTRLLAEGAHVAAVYAQNDGAAAEFAA